MTFPHTTFWSKQIGAHQAALLVAAYPQLGIPISGVSKIEQLERLVVYYGELLDLLNLMEAAAWLSIRLVHKTWDIWITRQAAAPFPPLLERTIRNFVYLPEVSADNTLVILRPSRQIENESLWFLYGNMHCSSSLHTLIYKKFTKLQVERELTRTNQQLLELLGGDLAALELIFRNC
jgi:hypothetical protein